MVRKLKAAHFGQDYVRFVIWHDEPGRIFVRGLYGTVTDALNPENTFVAAQGLLPMEREITGGEYKQFLSDNAAAYTSILDALVLKLDL